MKKTLIAAFLIMGMAGVSKAAAPKFKVPVSVNSIANPSLESAGVEKAYLVNSTAPALVTDSAGITMSDGFVYWIMVPSTSTLPNNVYCEIRDTATANITSARLIPPVPVNVVLSTSNALYVGGQPQNAIINFNPPLPFTNGLSVNLTPFGAAPGSGIEYAIGVRWKRQ